MSDEFRAKFILRKELLRFHLRLTFQKLPSALQCLLGIPRFLNNQCASIEFLDQWYWGCVLELSHIKHVFYVLMGKKGLNVSSVTPKSSQPQQVTLGLQRSLKRDTAYLKPVRPGFKLIKGIL